MPDPPAGRCPVPDQAMCKLSARRAHVARVPTPGFCEARRILPGVRAVLQPVSRLRRGSFAVLLLVAMVPPCGRGVHWWLAADGRTSARNVGTGSYAAPDANPAPRRGAARRQPRRAAGLRRRVLPADLHRPAVQHRARRRRARTLRDGRRTPDGDRIGFGGRRYASTAARASPPTRDAFDDYLGFLAPRLREAHRLLARRRARSTSTSTTARRTTASCCSTRSSAASASSTRSSGPTTTAARAKRRWPAKHDTILVYVKDPRRYFFDTEEVDREPYMAPGLVDRRRRRRAASCRPTSGGTRSCRPPAARRPATRPRSPRASCAGSSRPRRGPATGASTSSPAAGRSARSPRAARPPLRADRLQPRGDRGDGASGSGSLRARSPDARGRPAPGAPPIATALNAGQAMGETEESVPTVLPGPAGRIASTCRVGTGTSSTGTPCLRSALAARASGAHGTEQSASTTRIVAAGQPRAAQRAAQAVGRGDRRDRHLCAQRVDAPAQLVHRGGLEVATQLLAVHRRPTRRRRHPRDGEHDRHAAVVLDASASARRTAAAEAAVPSCPTSRMATGHCR